MSARAPERDDARVVIVTGAGRGIGRATAEAFGALGWRVAIAEQRRELGQPAARALARRKVDAFFVPTDVADARSVHRMVRRVLDRFRRIDVLVNNAGVLEIGPLVRLSVVDVQHIVAVNLLGPLLVARAVLPAMLRRGAGGIVNVASLLGKYGAADYVTYCATKFGVIGMTEALADELSSWTPSSAHGRSGGSRGAGVDVWAVCPGQVDTPLGHKAGVPAGGRASLIRPETVAKVIVDLATGRRRVPSGSAVDVPR